MPTVKELGDKRLKLFKDGRDILDLADKEGRALKPEEQTRYDAIMVDADKLHDEMKAIHGTEERRRKHKAAEDQANEALDRETRDGNPGNPSGDGAREIRWKDRRGNERVVEIREGDTRATKKYVDAYGRYLASGDKSELRTLQVDSGPAGGFLVPTQMAAGILRVADDEVFIRSLADVTFIPSASSLGIPTQEANPSDADWTSELADLTFDSAQTFGKRELKPVNLMKGSELSRRLVRMKPDIVAFVQGRLGYKLGITMEKAYMLGSGANQPLGIFVASANGISTARDMATGNTSTAITDAGLINCFYNLKAAYRNKPTTRWAFHRDAVGKIRQLKDSQGGYLLRPGQGLESNNGDKLLGVSLLESEYAPNTFTSGLYVGIIGDFSYYSIADSLEMEVQVLDQPKATQNKIQYLVRSENDGMPTFEEAFSRVKLG